ncbi:MAG TPA: hypothetical protein DFK16_10895 [Acidimicrobiaceae bacterium]|nr:hypothetical protein [Acidimicrobiaceae bacterium]
MRNHISDARTKLDRRCNDLGTRDLGLPAMDFDDRCIGEFSVGRVGEHAKAILPAAHREK